MHVTGVPLSLLPLSNRSKRSLGALFKPTISLYSLSYTHSKHGAAALIHPIQEPIPSAPSMTDVSLLVVAAHAGDELE